MTKTNNKVACTPNKGSDQLCHPYTCADPERFVSGGPSLTTSFLGWGGGVMRGYGDDPNIT